MLVIISVLVDKGTKYIATFKTKDFAVKARLQIFFVNLCGYKQSKLKTVLYGIQCFKRRAS